MSGRTILMLSGVLAMLGLTMCKDNGQPQDESLVREATALRAMETRLEPSMKAMGTARGNPLMIRVIKETQVLELWVRQPETGKYVCVKSYKMTATSGTLGPKKAEGDKQIPEGRYEITAKGMNPRSQFFLSMNIGYPNTQDVGKGYTGSNIMIHGGASSVGCIPIGDRGVAEVYGAVKMAFAAGETSVPVHIFPFEMTDSRMEQEQGNPNYEYWANLKELWDNEAEYTDRAPVEVPRGRP